MKILLSWRFTDDCVRLRLSRSSLLPLVIVSSIALTSEGMAKPVPRVVTGRRAIVIDERLSALRERPDLTSDLIQRLRRGRVLGILRDVRTREGHRFYRVSVTRRTSGWVLADAVGRSGSNSDALRLIQLVSEERDGFAKVRLASICVSEFGRTSSAPQAYRALAEAAEAVANELTRNAQRRLQSASQRAAVYMLNDVGLDRYNRIGVRFRLDGERLEYDGKAWRELLRRYPHSNEAAIARSRLDAE